MQRRRLRQGHAKIPGLLSIQANHERSRTQNRSKVGRRSRFWLFALRRLGREIPPGRYTSLAVRVFACIPRVSSPIVRHLPASLAASKTESL